MSRDLSIAAVAADVRRRMGSVGATFRLRRTPFWLRPFRLLTSAATLLALALFLLLPWGGRLAAQGSSPAPDLSEDEQKAAWIYLFLQATQWPEASGLAKGAPLKVVVIANGRKEQELAQALQRMEPVGKEHKLVVTVRPNLNKEEAAGYQVIYISESIGLRYTDSVLKTIEGTPALIVGELREFTDKGGALTLVVDKDQIKWELNEAKAQAVGLVINPKFLRDAEGSRFKK